MARRASAANGSLRRCRSLEGLKDTRPRSEVMPTMGVEGAITTTTSSSNNSNNTNGTSPVGGGGGRGGSRSRRRRKRRSPSCGRSRRMLVGSGMVELEGLEGIVVVPRSPPHKPLPSSSSTSSPVASPSSFVRPRLPHPSAPLRSASVPPPRSSSMEEEGWVRASTATGSPPGTPPSESSAFLVSPSSTPVCPRDSSPPRPAPLPRPTTTSSTASFTPLARWSSKALAEHVRLLGGSEVFAQVAGSIQGAGLDGPLLKVRPCCQAGIQPSSPKPQPKQRLRARQGRERRVPREGGRGLRGGERGRSKLRHRVRSFGCFWWMAG